MPIILRSEKGSPLEHAEMDGNFLVVRGLETPPFVAITPGMTVPSGAASLNASTGHPVVAYASNAVGTTQVDLILPASYYGIDLEIAILVAREGFSSDTFSIESRMNDMDDAAVFVDSGTILVATDVPQEYTLPNTFQLDGGGAQGLMSLAVRRDAPDASGTVMDLYQIIIRPQNGGGGFAQELTTLSTDPATISQKDDLLYTVPGYQTEEEPDTPELSTPTAHPITLEEVERKIQELKGKRGKL